MRDEYSVQTPGMVDPSGICCIEGPGVISIQSAELRLDVIEGKPLFTLGLYVLFLSLEYILSLPWGLSTNIDFLFMSKLSFEGHKQNIKKIVQNLNRVCRTNIDKFENVFLSMFSSVAPFISSCD